ncbi:MAG: ADOP family duplicated permease [Gemmatimonadota bacterium]
MKWLRRWFRRMSRLGVRDRHEREMDDEMRFHVQMEAEELERTEGLDSREARRRALVAFGGVEQTKERAREVRRLRWLEDFGRDLRQGLRSMRKSPGFAAVAVLTLALGIGATTAVYTVVNALLLEPLPYPESERVVYVYHTEAGDERRGTISIRNFFDVAERAESFEAIAATGGWFDPAYTSGETPVRLDGAFGSTELFRVLGVEPALGRGFSSDDPVEVAVVSHAFWRTRLGGRPEAVGETIVLDGDPVTVIGVMPEDFRAPMHLDAELWLHFPTQPSGRRQSKNMTVIGRLAPGVSEAQAADELASVATQLRAEHPDVLSEMGLGLRPLQEEMFGDSRRPLAVLLGAAALLLLVGCVNLSSVMLARAIARRRELGVRLALGAGHGRLVRQLLTEGLVLAVAGAAVGVLIAGLATRVLVEMGPAVLRAREVGMDGAVLLFAGGVMVIATLAVALLPALRAASMRLRESLGERAGAALSRGDLRLRDGLVVAQLAVTVVMLAGAGTLVRSLGELRAVDPGFQSDDVATVEVSVPQGAFDDPTGPIGFYDEVLRRVRALPGVERASVTSLLPFGGNFFTTGIRVEGRAYSPDEYAATVDRVVASPEYFATLDIPLLRGRTIAEEDRLGTGDVVVLNEHLADRLFGTDDPIGRRVRLSFADSARTVVGVVGDVRMESLTEAPRSQVYIPHAQWGELGMTLVVRASGDPLALVPSIRSEVAAVRPDQPIGDVATLDALLADARRPVRFMTVLLSALAAVALVIAAAGLYGVNAYLAQRRRREFGIRMALGARGSDVVRLVLRHGLAVVAVGLALGLAAAVMAGRVLGSLLIEAAPGDPWVLAGVAALLSLVSLVAGAVPAYAASRVDPRTALAAE